MSNPELPQVAEVNIVPSPETPQGPYLSCGDVLFLAEGENHLAEVPNLAAGWEKVHQAPSPRPRAPHATLGLCTKPSRAPREMKGSTPMSEQRPPSNLIVRHVTHQPTMRDESPYAECVRGIPRAS